jgi:hypothetical protein
MSRFVRPDTRTLHLANGDQLVVRARLTAGETRAQYARMLTTGPNGIVTRNYMMSGMAVVLAYLLDWNLTDDAGQLVPIRDLSPDDLMRVIDSLDSVSFEEIKTAIEDHETAMNAERDAQKKTGGGNPS